MSVCYCLPGVLCAGVTSISHTKASHCPIELSVSGGAWLAVATNYAQYGHLLTRFNPFGEDVMNWCMCLTPYYPNSHCRVDFVHQIPQVGEIMEYGQQCDGRLTRQCQYTVNSH